MGLGRPRFEISRLRVREPKLNIVPLSVDEVASFWSSFRNARDLAIVGLMLMHGLRSAEVMALNRDDVLFSEGQLRVRGKGTKLRLLPLAPETTQLIDHYLGLNPTIVSPAAKYRWSECLRPGAPENPLSPRRSSLAASKRRH